MPSLQTILFAATAALAGFASAAPAIGSLSARCTCDNVPSIIDNVKTQVAAVNVDLSLCIHIVFSLSGSLYASDLEAKIAAAKGAKVDVAVLSPPILQIKAFLEAAVPQVNAIAHDDPEVILPPKSAVHTVEGVATEVGSVVAVCLLCCTQMRLVLMLCFIDDRRYSPPRPDRCRRRQCLPQHPFSNRVCPFCMSKISSHVMIYT